MYLLQNHTPTYVINNIIDNGKEKDKYWTHSQQEIAAGNYTNCALIAESLGHFQQEEEGST
jgi:hypothetical protein